MSSVVRNTMIGVAALALGACASPAGRERGPDWVSGAAPGYSVSNYLLGRGSGDTLGRAQDRARAEIAKVFEVRIQGETRDEQTFRQEEDPSGRTTKASLDITRSLALRTDAVLSGVEIVETWHDTRTETYHALAVLRRAPASNRLRADLNRLDNATRTVIDAAREADDPLAAIAAANRAVILQSERAAVQRMLQVIDPTGRGVPAPWELAELRADRAELIGRVRIRPEGSADSAPEFEEILSGAVAEAGFEVASEDADFVLSGSLGLVPLDRIDEWHWVRGFLELTLREAGGPVRGEHGWSLKASATDPRTARRRALERVEETLDRELLTTLIDFAPDRGG